jgi:predicted MFS family arabinose efflux permease
MGVQQSAGAVARVAGPPIAGAMFDGVGVWSPMAMGSVISATALVLVVTNRRSAHQTASV